MIKVDFMDAKVSMIQSFLAIFMLETNVFDMIEMHVQMIRIQ